MKDTKSRHHGRQVDDFGKVCIGEIFLIEPVRDKMVGEASGGQHGFLFPFRIQCNASLIGIVTSGQTVQAFAGAAPSATSSTLFQFLRDHLDVKLLNVMG